MKFLPDAPRDTPEVLTEVEAVPTVRGYAGSPTVINGGYAALSAACNGAALIFKLDSSMRLFAGTQAKLYEGSGGTWTDRSRAGSYTTGDVRWCFAQFGDTTLAINKATVLQSSTTGAFADVANAPKAACMETVGGFVVLANTDDSGLSITGGPNAEQGNRWWCSQLFNATGTWAPSAATQATTGLLVSSPGKIVALKRLGDQVVAYKQRAIHVGQYVGPPDVFDWQLVPGEIGTWSNESVVSTGTSHLFIGYENVYRFDGSRPVPIGDGVREWFFARLNKSYAYLIAGIHDRNTSTVWWWYPSGSNTTLDSVLIYNYASDKWGHISDGVGLEPIPSAVTTETDPYYAYVKMLLHFNGTNGSTVFTDSSASPMTFTAVDNAALTTSVKKFGSASLALDGTLDEITSTVPAKFQNISGDFCFDGWLNLTSLGAIRTIAVFGSTSANGAFSVRVNASNNLEFLEIGGAGVSFGSPTVSAGTQTYFKVCRTAGVISASLGPVQCANTYPITSTFCKSTAEPVEIGSYSGSWGWIGSLDDLRLSVGTDRGGTASVTPPTTQAPDS